MAVTDFLFDTVTIKSISTVLTWWEETITETVIYSAIPCKIYEVYDAYKQTKESKQTSQSALKCIVTSDRTNIKNAMIAVVTNDLDWLWEYTIGWARLLKTVNGTNSHIEFTLNNKYLTR